MEYRGHNTERSGTFFELAWGLTLLSYFYKLGVKWVFQKRRAFSKWEARGIFHFTGAGEFLFWLHFLVTVPTCPVRPRWQTVHSRHPRKVVSGSHFDHLCMQVSGSAGNEKDDKISYLCIFEKRVEGWWQFCCQFIPCSFWPRGLNGISRPPGVFHFWAQVPMPCHSCIISGSLVSVSCRECIVP